MKKREYRVIIPGSIYNYRMYTDRAAGMKEAEKEFGVKPIDVILHTPEFRANENRLFYLSRAISNVTKYLHKERQK